MARRRQNPPDATHPLWLLGPWRVFDQGVVLSKSPASKSLRGTGWKVDSVREAVQPEIYRGTAQPGWAMQDDKFILGLPFS